MPLPEVRSTGRQPTFPANRTWTCPDQEGARRGKGSASNENQRFDPAIERRSVALMRACHPGPAFRKCVRTSRSSRIEIACFLAVPAGRPRRTTLRPTMMSASSNQDRFRAGASSGSRQARFEERFFTAICLPHRDDTPRVASRRPDQNNDVSRQSTDRYESRFAVISTIVDARHMPVAENQSGKGEVQATLLKCQRALGFIVCYAHELSYIQ